MASFGDGLNLYAKRVLRSTYKIDIERVSKSDAVKKRSSIVADNVLSKKRTRLNTAVRRSLQKKDAPQNAWTIQQNQNNPGTINNLWDYLTIRFPVGSVDSEGNPNDYKTRPQYTNRRDSIRANMKSAIMTRVKNRVIVIEAMKVLIERTKIDLTEKGISLKGAIKKLKQDVRELAEKRKNSQNSRAF